MFANIIEFCRYWFVLLFGTTVAVSFAGLERTKKNILAIGIMTNALFILQLIALLLFGFDNVLKLYPVLSHIPLVFFIVFYMKRSWAFSNALDKSEQSSVSLKGKASGSLASIESRISDCLAFAAKEDRIRFTVSFSQ
jgi:predicted transporter